jgi:hypothetical protein
MPTEDVLDFCISVVDSPRLDSVSLTAGNRLQLSPYFSLQFQGSAQQFGRDARPLVEIHGNRVAFRFDTSAPNRYYMTPSCPDILDCSSGCDSYSYFIPEKVSSDGYGGCWMLRNTGWYSRNYLRCVGGKIACDGRGSSDASRLKLVP